MTTRSRIIATVVALWATAVAAAGWYYSQHPYYVQHDRPVRDTGNRYADFYSEHFPTSVFAAAVAVATAVGLVVVLIATVWTNSERSS